MRGPERIVFTFRTLGEPRQPASLAQGANPFTATGQHLVRVALMGRHPTLGCRPGCRKGNAARSSTQSHRAPLPNALQFGTPRRSSRPAAPGATALICPGDIARRTAGFLIFVQIGSSNRHSSSFLTGGIRSPGRDLVVALVERSRNSIWMNRRGRTVGSSCLLHRTPIFERSCEKFSEITLLHGLLSSCRMLHRPHADRRSAGRCGHSRSRGSEPGGNREVLSSRH